MYHARTILCSAKVAICRAKRTFSLLVELGCIFGSGPWTFGSGPLLCQRFRRRREEMACKRKTTEISLVFVTIMLHVLMYVISDKLLWN